MTLKVEGAAHLQFLAARLKVADKARYLAMRRELRSVATRTANEVKSNYSRFSTTLPGSVAIRSRYTGRSVGIWIAALSSKLAEGHKPLARIQEFGTKRSRGEIRHPSRTGRNFSKEGRYVTQPSHPTLIPTAQKHEAETRAAMVAIMRETAKAAGFNL